MQATLHDNIADSLSRMSARIPHQAALIAPAGLKLGQPVYSILNYHQLEERTNQAANGLKSMGIEEGTKVVLMVKPSIDLFTLVFALFKTGAVPIMIDPGIGLKHLKQCIGDAEPDAFIGISQAHIARILMGWGKKTIQTKLWVGTGFSGTIPTFDQLLTENKNATTFKISPRPKESQAAILFTSGSTGTPKGVVYTHQTFLAQVEAIRKMFEIEPGDINLPTFPLFALFDPALGMTTVIPDMDPTRPAQADPKKLIHAINTFGITTMFGSPALLNTLGRYADTHGVKLPSMKRVISAGAPVPAETMKRIKNMLPGNATLFPPYGATESLPVACLEADEVISETWRKTENGAGICVGKTVPQIDVRILEITDSPIEKMEDVTQYQCNQVGEITVRGPMVTENYFNQPEATAKAKIKDGDHIWHRMGDLGYFDSQERLWFCGRKAHRVQITKSDTLFTTQVEGIFNQHPSVFRSALVGIGPKPNQRPVMCIEFEQEVPPTKHPKRLSELQEIAKTHTSTLGIQDFLPHPGLPVDIRHNAKINREKLSLWAEEKLS